MLESWKARILVAEKSEGYDTLRPKCIAVLVSCPAPFAKREEGVWTNVYRARVARAAWSARQSDARKKSHLGLREHVKNAINCGCTSEPARTRCAGKLEVEAEYGRRICVESDRNMSWPC